MIDASNGERVHVFKTTLLQVLNLLMDMPSSFVEVLIAHECLPRILQILELQLFRQAYDER